MIPKKIHYCWFGQNPFPKLVQNCIATWREHLSNYEFYLWNEENSPMDVPFVKEAYRAKKYAFVADYVRFWALYNHGGIYLDTDMFVIRSFDELLNNDCFFSWETHENNVIGCCVIGSEIRHNFLNIVLMHYNVLNFDMKNIGDFVIPRLVTPLYDNYNEQDIVIYPYDYFYPYPYSERGNRKFRNYATNNTYAIHLWNLSWATLKYKLTSALVKKIKKILNV